jgi:hypothetical protein
MRMQIPFADAVLSRLSRREAGLELIEEIEDEAVESVDAADLLSAEPTLLLQRMENRLIPPSAIRPGGAEHRGTAQAALHPQLRQARRL